MMDRGMAFISQSKIAENDSALGGSAHDSAHQIASQRRIAAIAAQASRSATLCSSRPRRKNPRRGRKLGLAIMFAAARLA
jgi:hypothetical protein